MGGGAAIASANARVSARSQQKIKFAGFYVLFLLSFFFFVCENVSTTKSDVIDRHCFILSSSFLQFLFVELQWQKSQGRQLTWNVNKDKSIAFNTVNLLNKFRKRYSLNHFLPSCFSLCKVCFKKSKSQAVDVWLSLSSQGIETNPGPGFSVVSQNCRGLSDS